MLFHPTHIDERQRDTTRYAAAIWLGVTQLLLVGVIFYRLYVLGQPDEQIRDFQAVLAISLFGYMGLQLFLGGIMPIPTWKGAVLFYVILASAIARRYSLSRTWSLPASGTGGSNARLSA
jgi:phosphoglycerol transferase MdoB-like AlkP superfamily enzyme